MKSNQQSKTRDFLNKLKPFFDFKIENFEDAFSVLTGIVVFSIIVFGAYFSDVTYDEAYTYLNTGRIQDVWKIYLFRIANTHLLNSLLMTVTTLFFPYADFALRLPSVLISGIYVAISISFSKKFNNRLIVLGLLLLFYYVVEYMTLARGYGMSATFILAALFVYKEKQHFSVYYLWVVYLFMLALYANYVAIVPFGIMVAYMFVVDFKFKLPEISVKNKKWIIGLGGLALYGFYSVTKAGKPLYGAYTQTFFEAIPQDVLLRFFEVESMPIQMVTIGTILLTVVVLGLYVIYRKSNPIGMITVVTFFAIFLVSWVGSKPLPTGRVLVPYWPMFVFAIVEVLEIITDKFRVPKLVIRIVNFAVFSYLVFNFQSQLEISKHFQTYKTQWNIPLRVNSDYGKEILPHDRYYVEKDNYHGILSERIKGINPDTETDNETVKISMYTDLMLLVLKFDKDANGVKLYREVSNEVELLYSDTITLGMGVFLLEDETMFLLPIPAMAGKTLKIGDVKGVWSESFDIPQGVAP
jgi:hypothetical protein